MADEIASGDINDKDRLLAWARTMIHPSRFGNRLVWLPKSLRPIFEVGLSVIISALLFIPILVLSVLLWMNIALQFVMAFVCHPERPKLTSPSELIKNVNAGAKLSEGGKKGGASKKRSNFIGERNEEIRGAAQERLAAGREFHELPSLLAEHFGPYDGYPKTTRSYRTIIKRLKKEKRANTTIKN